MCILNTAGLEMYRAETDGEPFDLSSIDTRDRCLFPGGKGEGKVALKGMIRRLKELQGLLWAGQRHSVLVVLQGLDTAGKDGTIRGVFGPLNPQGVRVSNFKVPSSKELSHDFLWRIHGSTPASGEIGVFNRSHYEDVLVVRVHGIVSPERCVERFRSINEFERTLCLEGTTILKFFLHISRDEQKARLEARLGNPHKKWKFSPRDLQERARWDDYREVYSQTLGATSTSHSPWYVVPADRKWYRNLVVAGVLLKAMEALSMKYPEPPDGLDEVVVI
jgi:PPK2 family polyphosphate:nucleotide phosphotransferase